jgi:hypothetical protein
MPRFIPLFSAAFALLVVFPALECKPNVILLALFRSTT